MNPRRLVGCLLGVLCSRLFSTAAGHSILRGLAPSAEQPRDGGLTPADPWTTSTPFLTQHAECSAAWTSWPSFNAEGAKENTFLVFKLFNTVGNLFIALEQLMRVARFLEVGVVLDTSVFPAFRTAFDPSEVVWDVSSEPIIQRAKDIEQEGGVSASGMHALTLADGALILSGDQFSRLEFALQVDGSTLRDLIPLWHDQPVQSMRVLVGVLDLKLPTSIAPHVKPCAWNMLLNRSPALVEKLVEVSPWKPMSETPDEYVAWHLRTVDPSDRLQGYKADVHVYMITEPASVVYPIFRAATADFQASCPSLLPPDLHIFLSANSKDLANECITEMAVDGWHGAQINIGGETHTAFSKDPNAAMSAFLDFMSLIDATVILRTGSSFSAMVAKIKGLSCKPLVGTALSHRGLSICTPRDLSC